MFTEILDAIISTIVDGLENFFDVVTYPSRKYIKTAIYINCGFLVFSLAGLLMQFPVFVDYYEVLTAMALLLIIYFVSNVTSKQVQDVSNLMMERTTKFINTAKKQVKSVGKKTNKSKKKKVKR